MWKNGRMSLLFHSLFSVCFHHSVDFTTHFFYCTCALKIGGWVSIHVCALQLLYWADAITFVFKKLHNVFVAVVAAAALEADSSLSRIITIDGGTFSLTC